MSLNDKKKLANNSEKRTKIKEIKNDELNKQCFDCGSCYPEYISINNGVFICKDCLHIHNKFPKQISTTLKNNLSSLNSKELEFMYLGGNQKLLEFVNYEYPELQKFKINILYQTKAMQYYRNNLYYKVYGGPKPVKPNEKINAYEIVDPNDLVVKNEKIGMKKITKINKINNGSVREKKRNKSLTKIDLPKKTEENQEKSRMAKLTEERRRKLQLDNNNEDTLKRHKSFYKEMNKLFGSEINNDFDDASEESIVYKKQKIKKENFRRKSEFDVSNEKNKYVSQTNKVNTNKTQKYPVEHIYNNNYFTLSATKNIFMFTPNKDSIIYKHRKINDPNYAANNKNNNINPDTNKVKEIYYKPKIPYIINPNNNQINNNYFFSLQDNVQNIEDKKNNYINNFQTKNNNNIIKTINTYTMKSRKSKKDDGFEDIDINLKQKISKDDNDMKHNGGNIIKNNKKEENGKKEMFTKKSLHIVKNERNNNEKNNNYINLRNNKIIFDNTTNDQNKNINNKTELKEIKIEKIIRTINSTFNNEVDNNNNDQMKNKIFTGSKGLRRKKNEKNLEAPIKNPIRIEEGDEENNSPQKGENNKEHFIKTETRNDESKELENKIIKKEAENKNEQNNIKKIFLEKRKQRLAKFLQKDEKKENRENDDKDKCDKNKKEEKKTEKKEEIITQNIKTEVSDKRIYKIPISENNKDIKKSKDLEQNEGKKGKNNKLENKWKLEFIEPKKYSIRNKYKMKRLNEA